MPYEESWMDLQRHAIPAWLRAAKSGIYTHWRPYAVPACGPNATWYAYNMYREGSPQHAFHLRRYDDPAVFGYKDFLPLFPGEHFDPEEWGIFSPTRAHGLPTPWASTTTASRCGTPPSPRGTRGGWDRGVTSSASWRGPSAREG